MNWSGTVDYSFEFKTQFSPSLIRKWHALDVGLPNQKILVVGCNNGALAVALAKNGAKVTAIDSCADYIEALKKKFSSVDFIKMEAEAMDLDNHSFDVVIAHQSLRHFQVPKFLMEAKRLLQAGGLLVTSNERWLPRLDILAKKSEEIILEYNPRWAYYDFNGEIFPTPNWAMQSLNLKAMFQYDEAKTFSQKKWMGRLKASSAVSGTISKSKVLDFESDLTKVIEDFGASELEIRHRIDSHLFQFK